jgi:hypothetical protein
MADKKISQLTAASTPLAGTEVLPIVQSSTTKKVATDDLTVKNVRSNATTGILQVAGPAVGATRVMTVPDANFTAARTDAAQTFSGVQTFSGSAVVGGDSNSTPGLTVKGTNANNAVLQLGQTGKAYRIIGGDYQGAMELFTESGAGDILFTVAGATRGRMTTTGFRPVAGAGIDFSANTGAAGMTSELLTWYEEGTWTPLNGNMTVVGTLTTSGTYTRIGRQVTVCGKMVSTTSIAASVAQYIVGLPFTCGSLDALGGLTTGSIVTSLAVLVGAGSTSLYVCEGFGATPQINFSATYFV